MKKVFQAGAGILGEGRTKICVPIVAARRDAIWEKAEEIASLPVDIAEWRADFYEHFEEHLFQTKMEEISRVLEGLKERLKEKALLFTFRTKGEGGSRDLHKDDYYRLNIAAARSGADLVDVEAYLDEKRTAEEIEKLRRTGCRVIASNHDFHGTPSVNEMVRRLRQMETLGADAAKLAVMPMKRQDVLDLLQASVTADELLEIPVITMSMGKLGMPSRICGGLTGSAMTFAAVGETSAPGQLPAEQMNEILKLL